jgi:hypothetical protein
MPTKKTVKEVAEEVVEKKAQRRRLHQQRKLKRKKLLKRKLQLQRK